MAKVRKDNHMVHKILLSDAESAISELMSDTSVPIAKTLESMEKLKNIIECDIEGLREDLRKELK